MNDFERLRKQLEEWKRDPFAREILLGNRVDSRAALELIAPEIVAQWNAIGIRVDPRAKEKLLKAELRAIRAHFSSLDAPVDLSGLDLRYPSPPERDDWQDTQQAWTTSIKFSKPPGYLMRRLSEFLFSRHDFTRVFEPTLDDLQHEYLESLAAGALWRARWVRVRGIWAFWSAFVQELPFVGSALRKIL